MSDDAKQPGAARVGAATQSAGRFARLPARIPPEDLVEEVPADTAKDPDFGRDPDRDWLLRTT